MPDRLPCGSTQLLGPGATRAYAVPSGELFPFRGRAVPIQRRCVQKIMDRLAAASTRSPTFAITTVDEPDELRAAAGGNTARRTATAETY